MEDLVEKLREKHGQADPAQLKQGAPISGSGTDQYPEPATSAQVTTDDKPDTQSLEEYVSRPLSATEIVKRLRTIYGMFKPEDDDVRDVIEQAAKLIKARPKVAIECEHYRPDGINPKGGMGSCAIEANGTPACDYPRAIVVCTDWTLGE